MSRMTTADINPKYLPEIHAQLAKKPALVMGHAAVHAVGGGGKARPEGFVIPGQPIGKPRMTQRDKWAKRPAVLRYRTWADLARASAPMNLLADPEQLRITAFFKMPQSWSKKKRGELSGMPHRSKPDADNVAKAVMDSLWINDSCISDLTVAKRWESERFGPMVQVEHR